MATVRAQYEPLQRDFFHERRIRTAPANAKTYRTSTSPPTCMMKDPSGCLSDNRNRYMADLNKAEGSQQIVPRAAQRYATYLSITSQPSSPAYASAHTAAYVGARWLSCPGPPPNPPSAFWNVESVAAVRARSAASIG